MLNLVGKQMEKVVHRQLLEFVLSNNHIANCQYGFLPGRSTVDAIFKLTNDLYSARNCKHFASIVFLDLRKAFETVNHSRLLLKLRTIGCSFQTILWFKSYLENRSQATVANATRSEVKSIACGVPQGSVLGPLLFILYINGIVDCIKNAKCYLYADDLALMVSAASVGRVTTLMQEDLNGISEWCQVNRLTVKCEKTKVMWSHSNRVHPDLTNCGLYVQNTLLQTVKSFIYLGATIDYNLSFAG